ncbi:hypothetical protein J633_1297 [Acinetobacter sp. 216872]|nr:hypothetical protein J633_1297 [Acinetobacter sp. 216872]
MIRKESSHSSSMSKNQRPLNLYHHVHDDHRGHGCRDEVLQPFP